MAYGQFSRLSSQWLDFQNAEKIDLIETMTHNRVFDALWDPLFSPDGKQILLRYIEDGKYCREVLAVGEFFS